MRYLYTKPIEATVEISATIFLIAGVSLNSYNIYPLNLYVNIVANILWFALGIIWEKWSLIIIQIVVLGLYFAGAFRYMVEKGCFMC